MEIEILDEDENPMLHRTDVRFEVVHNEATPERLSVRDSLAARLNKDAEEVVVRALDTKYGMRRSVGYAKVYETADAARAVEQEYMLRRNKIGADGEEVVEEVDDEETGGEEAETDADEDGSAEADEAGTEEAEVDEADAEEAEVDAEEAEAEDETETADDAEEAEAEEPDAEESDDEAEAEAEEA